MSRTIEQLIENLSYSLSEYEDINNSSAVSVVKDEIMELNEHLTKTKGADEGYHNNSMHLFIEAGQPIPALFSTVQFDSEITGTRYEITVREIVSVEWAPENKGINITILGTKRPIQKVEESEING